MLVGRLSLNPAMIPFTSSKANHVAVCNNMGAFLDWKRRLTDSNGRPSK